MKECLNCGAKLRGNHIKCPECNASLDVKLQYICTNCEHSFFGKRSICPQCGSNKIYRKSEYL